jgi:DNA-binding NtrC family response regulator
LTEVVDVLVIDDATDVAESTADVLRSAGLSVATASNVREARRIVAERRVRAVIVDHSTAEWAGSAGEPTPDAAPPIIVVSGMGRDSIEELQARHGDCFFACLAKPVPPGTLIEVVRAALAA